MGGFVTHRNWKLAWVLVLAVGGLAAVEPREAPATRPGGKTASVGKSAAKGATTAPAQNSADPLKGADKTPEGKSRVTKDGREKVSAASERASNPEAPASAEVAPPADAMPASPAEVSRHLLIEGNARFSDGAVVAPRRDEARRCEVAAAQHPIAAILSCADSRAPVEVLFDQGIGDLFVVRVAGNVASPSEIGSLEYAVDHLDTPLIVVLGHTKCGAVRAAVEEGSAANPAAANPAEANVAALLADLRPAADEVRRTLPPNAPTNALVSAAVRANVRHTVRALAGRSDALAAAQRSGKVRIVGAVYDILSGTVQWLEPETADPLAARPLGGASAALEGGEGEMLRTPPEPATATDAGSTERTDHTAPTAAKAKAFGNFDSYKTKLRPPEKSPPKELHKPAEGTPDPEDKPAADKAEKNTDAKTADPKTAQPVRSVGVLQNKTDRWIVIGAGSLGVAGIGASVAQWVSSRKRAKAAPSEEAPHA
jgi:carbonic anhydrase